MTEEVVTRFLAKVDKTSDCWIWTAARTRGGYGRFKVNGKTQGAHRWLYEQVVGPIPQGLQLDHLCRVTSCVRPDHLEPVTGRVNLLRGDTFQASNSRKTHCVKGHPFTPDNIISVSGKWRSCRQCNRTRAREYQRRKFGYSPRTGGSSNGLEVRDR